MTFQEAVDKTSQLQGAWKAGLQALKATDKQHIEAEDPRLLSGSVDIDTTLKSKYPKANRWDYGIGNQPTNLKAEIVYWVEVHPASPGDVIEVLAKLSWLKDWLKRSAPDLKAMPREYIWVSSGKTSFTLSSPQQKRFAAEGLQHKGRVFRIPSKVAD